MSKINAVRLINLNYNNNAIKISDETLHLNGDSTLISLKNGGGKTVLVQMIMAPFVHKRYRDGRDRPFESYFTGNKPTFILVEWVLDQGAGYVLTGMMVRKNQNLSGDDTGLVDELEIISLINEYREPCINDLNHIPVVEKTKKELNLKNFGACCQMFETWKRDKSMNFSYYDMNNTAQSRQYFEKLKEYQINYKEWESIIKKVNLKESGLSDLFADCRDEKGLVEKWFLDAVESKLNRDKNRMKEFQSIIDKYVKQYKDNRSKIERRDTIRRFQEEGEKIRNEAIAYKDAFQQVAFHENRIAGLREELERLRTSEFAAREVVINELAAIREQRDYLIYKKLSGEFYELEKKEQLYIHNRDDVKKEQDALEQECTIIQNKIHLLECAKAQKKVDDENKALHTAVERLDVSKQQKEQLEPERLKLGATLRKHYQGELETWENKQVKNTNERAEIQKLLKEHTDQLEEIQNQIIKFVAKIAEQNIKIANFDQKEKRYNARYSETLARNILGEYEPGFLQIRQQIYEQALASLSKSKLACRQDSEDMKEKKKGLERTLEDLRQELAKNRQRHQELTRISEEFEKELSERKNILRYLDLDESQCFETEKILNVSGRKLEELHQAQRALEQEEEQQKQEYERLTQGKVLELPKEFEAMLNELGIRCVYGMKWLRKNNRSSKENKKLVKRHPFLPYSLILSSQELDTLTNHMNKGDGKEVYSSFPIPIMLREQLEDNSIEKENIILGLDGICFYVYFNQNLLDEKTLNMMVEEKERQLEKLKTMIDQKQIEYREYFGRQEKIRNQKVTADTYQKNQVELNSNNFRVEELKDNIDKTAAEVADLEKQIETTRNRIQELEQDEKRQQDRLVDFKELTNDYEIYMDDRRDLVQYQNRESNLKNQKEQHLEQMEQLNTHLKTLEHDATGIQNKVKSCRDNFILYEDYTGTDFLEGTLAQLETRYKAITEGVSQEQKELENRVKECKNNYQNAVEDLEWCRSQYNLEDGSWAEILYSREEETHQKSTLDERSKKKKETESRWYDLDKKISLIHQEMDQKRKQIAENCGKEEPLPKAELIAEDIQARLNELDWQEKEKKNYEESHSRKISYYENNLTSLADYNHLEYKEAFTWEQDFSRMNRKQLDNFKGETVREYRSSMERSKECQSKLVDEIYRTLRIDVFQEDFYKKPLESILELSQNKDAEQVLVQIQTTVQSYQNLMEKLDVDISKVEREKEKISELLEDYLKDVHDNLGKIDHSSTITIRNRPIKMLKIILPLWDENVSLYRLRISDFLDEITKNGLEHFEHNENPQEYFGLQLTTNNLYDTVVGISNVQVHLYKIEEQREYAITWADVAKNSGGEGFLSAFTILSSLLYYMRRDDSDFFADRNEGKVLIMDNPFAQTNASHLLKPLMDMAKKTNTQLICLSGLGGESIYNRFDNIYVLNLIAASLRNSVQYLKAEHMKGTDPMSVMSSRIQVTEQMELLF